MSETAIPSSSLRRLRSSSRRRILIVSSYYHPEPAGNAPYVTGVAEHLAAQGHTVRVLTGFAHYPSWHSTSAGRLAAREHRHGVEILRRWHYVPGKQSAGTRAAYEATLAAFGATGLPRRRPDVVVGISPTLAAAALARLAGSVYRLPYGLVYQDLQGRGAAQSGIAGGARVASLVELAEVSIARGAAAVGVIAEGFGPYFVDHGVDPARIHRLRNWSQDAIPSESVPEARKRLGWGPDEFICLHAGNMGHKQRLENVLQAAAAIEDPLTRIVLAGEGNERQKLETIVGTLRLANVSFVPPQPVGLYESMLCAADVLIVNQRASVGDMSLASKLTSYFMTSRPIIASVTATSETGRELQAAGAGMLAPAEDPEALAAAIDWMREHPEEAAAFGAAGRTYAAENLTPASVLAGYDAFIEKIARSPDTRPRQVRPSPARVQAAVPVAEPPRASQAGADVQVALSCLIVSYRSAAVLEQCLTALDTERQSLQLEAIVVDNASRDGTPELIERRFPWVQVIAHAENGGFAQATNVAMRRARGPLILHLNPDTIVPAGGLVAAIAELARHPEVGMLGGKLVRSNGEFDHACKRGAPTIASSLYYFAGLGRMFPRSSRFAHYTAGDLDKDEAGYVDAITGAFMLVRREAVEEVGEFDERYWLYGEDLDWCARFWQHGWRILYWPGIEVTHIKGGSTGDYRSWRVNVAFYRSMWLYYKKHLSRHHSRFMTEVVRVGISTGFAGAVVRSAVGSALRSVSQVTRGDDATHDAQA